MPSAAATPAGTSACTVPTVKPDAVIFTPILRYGRAVSASRKKQRFALMESQLESSIAALKRHRRKFVKPLRSYFVEKGWDVDDKDESLSGFNVVRKQGAVLDFPEIIVSKDGCRNVVRVSITVCVDNSAELEDEQRKEEVKCDEKSGVCYFIGDSDLTLYSKLWIRTASLEYDGQEIVDKTAKRHLEFVTEFEEFSREIIDMLLTPYKKVLSDLTKIPTDEIEISGKQDISNLTVSGKDKSLSEMHDKIRYRQFVVEGCKSLDESNYRYLFEEYFNHLNGLKPIGKTEIGCKSLHAFSTRFTKAVYSVAYMSGVTRVFGIAHEPFWSPDESIALKGKKAWKYSPGNAVGAIAMSGIASSL